MKASISNSYIKRALSSPQKRIHFSEFYSRELAINNICVAYFLEKNTPIQILSSAIDQAFISYPTLRIRLTQEGSTAHQYMVPFSPQNITEYEHFHNTQESETWFSTMATEKIPYWDSPLAGFYPFRIGNGLCGFVLRTHHIISDGWTHQLVTKEIFESLNRTLPWKLIRRKKASYWDFVKTDENYNQSVRYDYDKKYWYEKLFPLPGKTGLFIEKHPRSQAAQRHQLFLGSEKSKEIRAFCERESLSFSSFFLWILMSVIHLRTGLDDFLVGMLTHNRIGKSEKQMAGMFVSTIALKASMDSNATLSRNLQNIQSLLAGSMRHQRFPLSGIKPSEDDIQENLFDHLEIIYTYDTIDFPFEHKFISNRAENFPLVFRPSIRDGQDFKIEMDFRKDSIDINQIQSFGEQYLTVLEAVLDNKNQLLKSTSWVSRKDVKRVVNEFNHPVTPPEQPLLIHQFLENQAELTPDKTAISFGSESLSYKSLNCKSNKVARRLIKELGEGEHLIALLMDRSLDLMILLYAILKAGFAYVPLNKEHPVQRNLGIIEAAGVKKLFTDDEYYTTAFENCITFHKWDCSVGSEHNLELPLECDTLAYIIYTSGSTGIPKGVMLEHGPVSNRLLWMRNHFSLEPHETILHKTPYTFDVSVPELFAWPISGSQVHFLGPGEEKDPSSIIRTVNEKQISFIHFVPSMLGIFLDYIENRTIKNLFETVRIVVCSGEALDSDTIARFWRIFDKDRLSLYNLYGPTEAAVDVTYHECLPSQSSPVPIGKPITNVQLLVLSKQGQILPPGIQGELCIAGPCLARGYFNAPELTGKVFVNHPLDKKEKIYKTGDLASWTDDGDLLYHGRIDNQVKIRGNRIEIGEIEEALRSHKDITDAVVLVQKDKKGQDTLAGHYCARGNCDSESLRLHLSDRIPQYMIPGLWKEHKSFCLTTSGKTDRRSIKPISIKLNAENKLISTSSIEASIMNEWKKVLPADDFSCDDDFFKIGGDSFGLITVFTSLENRYGLTLQELFDYSTINSLSRYILENKKIAMPPTEKGTGSWEKLAALSAARKKLREYEKTCTELRDTGFPQNKVYKNILITGATGFFGIHMVETVLQMSDAQIVLLIRSDSEKAAGERFLKLWTYYFPHSDPAVYEKRISFFTGDLSEEKLGLSEPDWITLAESVDSVIHAGANVRHYGRYEDFTDTNIKGTRTLIELVKQGNDKEFHYISTVSLHLLERASGLGYFFENDFPEEPHLENHYLDSKWEAERLLRTSGINVSFYRLGNLTVNSKTGIFQINPGDNAFFQSILAYKTLGSTPVLDEEFIDMTSVDLAAGAVWTLMTITSQLRCFHIFNPHRVSLNHVARWLDLEQLDREDFNSRFSGEKELFMYAPYLKNPGLLMTYPRNDHTDIILNQNGFEWCQPGDSDFFHIFEPESRELVKN